MESSHMTHQEGDSCSVKFWFILCLRHVKSSLFCVFRLKLSVNDRLLIKINYNLFLMTQTLKGKRCSLWYIKIIIVEIAR